MKEAWLKKEECTACGACENICPKGAIFMKSDSSGFSYPCITTECIDCNLCEKVCNRRLKKQSNKYLEPKVYAAWSNNDDTRYNSTSGGLFSELAKVVLDEGGYAVGAKYNSDNLVEHMMISDENGLEKIRQSKYVQSNIGLIFKKVKGKLQNNNKVIFCGSPCQIAGLYAYLGEDNENLITIDFICRGMNSPKAYKAWLNELEKKYKQKVSCVWFKYKVNGWKSSPRCTRVDFADGKNIVVDGKENTFMSGYLEANLYIRPSCGQCDFKGIPRQADITLADFWGIDTELDDDKGTSLVIVNSSKGEDLFKKTGEKIFFEQRKLQDILKGNVCFNDSVNINPKSEEFLKSLDNQKFSKAIKKYTNKTLIRRIARRIRYYQRILKQD